MFPRQGLLSLSAYNFPVKATSLKPVFAKKSTFDIVNVASSFTEETCDNT